MKWWWMLLLCAMPMEAAERAYWVWQRAQPLADAESAELKRQGVATLYWHVATMDEKRKVRAHVSEPARMAEGFRVVPVVRVETGVLPPAADLQGLRRFAHEGALQLDFDCPDRQLGAYAAGLAALRREVPHLGITALAHWPRVKGFGELAGSVEELCPMFYDLQNDPTGVSAQAAPPPLLDPAQVEKLLAGWSRCPARWRAGLPVFTRVTIFDGTGLSRGQIPGWEWDEVAFNKHLRTTAPTRLGLTLLRAESDTMVARRPIRAGEMLAVRLTDRGALEAAGAAAEKAGAAGTVLFRLPEAGSHATASLRSLASPAASAPRLVLERRGEALILRNDGEADLVVRLAGGKHDRDRGYELELDAPAPVFREAVAGEFFRVSTHTEVKGKMQVANVTGATRLTFWFSHLPAGGSLRSGIFQLSPTADPAKVQWRVGGGEWKPLPTP